MVVQTIERRGVEDPDVLHAMRTVERHRFVRDEYLDAAYEDLLVPVVDRGRQIYEPESLRDLQTRTRGQLEALPDAVKRLKEPRPFPVVRDGALQARKQQLIAQARGEDS